MRVYPDTTVDYEFKTLGDLGFTGSLNDRQFSHLRAQGLTGSLPDMFKQLYDGTWVIVGTLIDAAPVVGVPATPVIQDGVLYGPQGIYRVVNNTLLTDEEVELTPPTPLDSLGSPGDSLTIYYYVFSSQSPEIDLPSGSTQIMVTAVGTLARSGTTVTLTPATWDQTGVTVAREKTINGVTTALVGTTFTVALFDDYSVSEVASKSGFLDSDPAVTATGYYAFQETWDWLTAGDTWTQVDARYTRSSTVLVSPVVADATAPSGEAVQFGVTSNAQQAATDGALSTALSGRTTEVVEGLVLFRLLSTASARSGFGHRAALDQHTGIYIQRIGAADQRFYAQGVGSPGANTNISAVVGTYSDGDLVWCRFQVDGVNVRARTWLDGAGEGSGWTTYTHGSALAFTSGGPMVRTGNPCNQILYYSLALDNTAPGP